MKANKLFSVLFAAFVGVSCSDIYDNIKDFSPEERVYPARFDIVTVSYGYERVEFDFGTQGRVPASQMYLGKAKKTIVEYTVGDESKREVFDSVCSWVNITGLTQPRIYEFKIFTEDQYGNPSIAQEVSVTPFTSEDVSALAVTPPSVVESTAAAAVEWRNPIVSDMYSWYRYKYEYTDRDNHVQRDSANGNLPSFLVENVNKNVDIPIKITARIVPKMNGVSIIDSIDWEMTYNLRISPSAIPAILLKKPAQFYTFDADEIEFPLEFAWVAVDEATGYDLKVSSNPNFSDGPTIDAGTGNSYLMTKNDASALIASFNRADPFRVYWTIAPRLSSTTINQQSRNMTAIRAKNMTGWWTFDDPTNLLAAQNGGIALVAVETGGAITSVAGPTATDRAIRIPQGSYLRCNHGLLPVGGTNVNTYSVAFDVKIPETGTGKTYSLLSARNGYGTPTQDADIFINADGKIGVLTGTTATVSENGLQTDRMGFSGFHTPAGRWTRIVLVADITNNFYMYYADGLRIREGRLSSADIDGRFSLLPEGCLLFADDNGEDEVLDVANVQFYGLKLSEYEIRKLGGVAIREYDKTSWKISTNMLTPSYSVDSNPSRILDSNPITYTFNWSGADVLKYFNIDMTEVQEIHSLAFYGRLVEEWPSELRTVDVFAGNDGSTWTLIASHDYQVPVYETTWQIPLIDLPTPVNARWLRVEMNRGLANATFGEIHVFGKK
ncbi:discoidin domain-containing protein [Candidatus Symbiothrix dinenymphae]|uniref:discoidin domain-containing protein n=1 Tax=Candidatus Symbiothrix dinenymphae TaxID=467085 RepID=UPI0006C30015|nr:discoidin domain-containing protein [Candidatus Symbiothrix dinenymphae]GAP72925.1 hypothetical protein SAMD00024442_5_44 [Candidatus Symbiothrix dinenymphae]